MGYIRGYAGHIDAVSTYEILSNNPKYPLCKTNQQTNTDYSPQYPHLKAKAGDRVTFNYTENGHVTKDRLAPDGRPHPGNYSLFWTGTPTLQLTILGDLTFGNRMSGPYGFDDGRCAEDATMGRQPRPCSGSFTVPNVAPALYAMVWAWDFPKIPQSLDPNYIEIYTSCFDIEIVP